MPMMSFVFFGLVALLFILLLLINKRVKDDGKAIKTANIILLVASYGFVLYADWRFVTVLAEITFVTYFCVKKESMRKYGIINAIVTLALVL